MTRTSIWRCVGGAVAALALAMHASLPLHAADDGDQTRVFRYIMGTSIRVDVFGGDEAARQAAAEEAFGAMGEVDRLMSDYRADSELSLINQSAGRGPVAISAPMLAVLGAAERVSRASGGAFDITVQPLLELWGFKNRKPHLPTDAELSALRPLVGFRNVVLNPSAATVQFAREGVRLDLGGIAKGFAVELAAGSLRRRGLSGVIDAGGNQYLVGQPVGKHAWSIGIGDPDTPARLLGALDVPAGAVSTSADSSNFLTVGGRRYGHLFDPRTLRPSDASLSVTIVSDDGTLSDALSKAVFVLGPKEGLALLAQFPHTWGVVAYRDSSGGTVVAITPGFSSAFHPVALKKT